MGAARPAAARVLRGTTSLWLRSESGLEETRDWMGFFPVVLIPEWYVQMANWMFWRAVMAGSSWAVHAGPWLAAWERCFIRTSGGSRPPCSRSYFGHGGRASMLYWVQEKPEKCCGYIVRPGSCIQAISLGSCSLTAMRNGEYSSPISGKTGVWFCCCKISLSRNLPLMLLFIYFDIF